MMGTQGTYTLSIYSDNSPGMLQRISVMFTRRKLNIESISASETEVAGISQLTIMVFCDRDTAEKVSRQIRRVEEVHEVFVSRDEEFVGRELVMFKLKKLGVDAQRVCADLGCTLLEESAGAFIFEKSGNTSEIEAMLHRLPKQQLLEFVRSGRIGLRREDFTIADFIEDNSREPEPDALVWI